MTELVRGTVADRPWGLTFGALGLRGLTGQLTLRADGKSYCVAFDHGAIVGATSPVPSDSIARVALINHFAFSPQITEITRRIAAAPDRDEVEILAELNSLSADQTLRLRRRLVAQRAARTFSIDAGEFVVDDQVAITTRGENALDVRAVVYLGARMNLPEQRLADDLRPFGSYFVLKPIDRAELAQYGFTTAEQPILDALRTGSNLPELEAKHREIDPRTLHAIVYSLLSCAACEATAPVPLPEPAPLARTATPPADTSAIAIKPTRPEVGGQYARPITSPGDQYSHTHTGARDVTTAPARTTHPSAPRTVTPQPTRASTANPAPEVRTSVKLPLQPRDVGTTPAASDAGLGPLDPVPQRTTTPTTGVPRTTTPPTGTRSATPPTGTRTTTPPAGTPAVSTRAGSQPWMAAPTGVPSPGDSSRRLPVMSPDGERHPITGQLSPLARTATPPEGVDKAGETGEFAASRTSPELAAMAGEAFTRGNSALNREDLAEAIAELSRAATLSPSSIDYQAVLAWARFIAASDKQAIADNTRKALQRAIQKSTKPEMPLFYLGRVERMLGRDREALHYFRELLERQPRHADAKSEVRMIELRLHAAAHDKGGGLFGRKR